MLELKKITKVYELGNPNDSSYQKVEALKGVSVQFRKTEFVSILGPSGCGKTTMLNIIGGLDHYSDGDLIINGKSTKDYKDRDWDNYRNHRIGFVFQNYNLISHQTVLENVELALTLSGVSKNERKKKAEEALIKVGLGDKLNAKPTQLSGGQMQRVAIARALVNNPDIILADEPTGALDTNTSVQIMEILKEISKEKLIIMVTHNPELANQYSTRIIRLLDGILTDDTNPYNPKDNLSSEMLVSEGKTNMSFTTALSLSGKNLLTKKGRTILVSFAGSIGIIGISLILSLSSGFQMYINNVQQDTLSTYPLTLTTENIDYSAAINQIMGLGDIAFDVDEDGKIHSSNVMVEIFEAVTTGSTTNNLKKFKEYIESHEEEFEPYTVKYTYNANLNVYDENAKLLNPTTVFTDLVAEIINEYNEAKGASMNPEMLMQQAGLINAASFVEMLDNQTLLESQYDLVAEDLGSRWPSKYDEAVLVINGDYTLEDFKLYALSLQDEPSLNKIAEDLVDRMIRKENGEELGEYEVPASSISYEEVLNKSYRILLDTDYFEKNNQGYYDDKTEDQTFIKSQVSKAGVGIDLKIVGIVRPNKDATAHSITSPIGYTPELIPEIIKKINESSIVQEQLANPEIDVLTGQAFPKKSQDVTEMRETMKGYLNMMTFTDLVLAVYQMGLLEVEPFKSSLGNESQLRMLLSAMINNLSDDQIKDLYDSMDLLSSYQGNMTKFGKEDVNTPYTISFYCKDFESKDDLKELIENYNKTASEEDTIRYTDYAALMMTSISTIINAISYVLIAFVSVSLIVSSIMIGIITYISVLERTKEIGVLRSIGASKKDIKRVFTAESLIIGFTAGMLGILITLLLCIPINMIMKAFTGISTIASLPIGGGIILVLISMLLTFIAGLIPAQVASKKDPVIALRSE